MSHVNNLTFNSLGDGEIITARSVLRFQSREPSLVGFPKLGIHQHHMHSPVSTAETDKSLKNAKDIGTHLHTKANGFYYYHQKI